MTELMNYLEPPDVPEGMTLLAWRRSQCRRPRWRRRTMARLRHALLRRPA